MSEEVDRIMGNFDESQRTIFEELGPLIVEDMKELIGVPVGLVGRDTSSGRFKSIRGPRGGKKVIRSKPGEPPRKDDEYYQGSFYFEVLPDQADGFILEVYTHDIRAIWFEGGTKHMAKRPHFGIIFRRWAPIVQGRLLLLTRGLQ